MAFPLTAIYVECHRKLNSKYYAIKMGNISGSHQCNAYTPWHILNAVYRVFFINLMAR